MPEDLKIANMLRNEFRLRKSVAPLPVLLEETESLFELLRSLGPRGTRFDRRVFGRVRNEVGPQSMWADAVGVSQGTIGNWERGYTAPSMFYCVQISRACDKFIELYREIIQLQRNEQQLDLFVDPVDAKQQLNHSILRAALTDFEFDAKSGKIVPVPFPGDKTKDIAEIEESKNNLLASLSALANSISDDLRAGDNSTADRLTKYFERYGEEASKESPNPRILGNFGDILRQSSNDEYLRSSFGAIDEIAIDQFNQDHTELMRLYFRAALARAQEVQTFEVDLNSGTPSSVVFADVATAIDNAQENQKEIIDSDIPTLLRDIANEIGELEDAERYSTNPDAKNNFKRRRIHAIKNGAIYVGRFVFFTSLFVTITPSSGLISLTSISSVVAIMEALVPGSVRSVYEKMREFLPLLPKLPVIEKEDPKD